MSALDREAGVAVPITPAKAAPARAFPWRRTALRVLATLVAVGIAGAIGWTAWRAYMGTPWTRDGTVRAYVVTIAPQVAGQIVSLPVLDNQLVHKGDLLMQIDPADYTIALRQAEAGVAQAKAVAQNAEAEWERRLKLNDIAVTVEERQIYASKSLSADAAYKLQRANLENARLNLQRTRIVSPVNGYVTNLLARVGDYANVGQRQVSVIDADSFWVDGYFEETFLDRIHDGDPALVKLMGYAQVLRGHVQSVARGINVANASPSASGLATVNPIFAFVRLAQRVPVRVQLDAVPPEIRLVAGMTATVEIEPGLLPRAEANASATAKQSPSDVQVPGRPVPTLVPGAPVPLPASEAAAEAILPGLSATGSGMSGAGRLPSERPAAPVVQPQAASRPEAASPARDAARTEANEILSDKAFDRSLNIEAQTSFQPPRHAPATLRRRGRNWRYYERR